jgi:hypothetical protein
MTTAPPTESVEVSANHTTDGEQVVRVDSTAASITVTIATSDLQAGNVIRVVDVGGSASSNPITVQTEGSSTFRPSGNTSVQITGDHAFLKAWCDGEAWYTERVLEVDDLVGSNIVDESNATNGLSAKKSVSRNVDGQVNFIQSGQQTLSATTTSGGLSTTLQPDGRVVLAKINGTVTKGGASISVSRGGSVITNSNGSISYVETVSDTSPQFGFSVSFSSLYSNTVESDYPNIQAANGNTSTSTIQFSKSGDILSAPTVKNYGLIAGPYTQTSGTFYLSYQGSQLTSTYLTPDESTSFVVSQSFTSPTITAKVHAGTGGSLEFVGWGSATRSSPPIRLKASYGSAKVTVSKNEVVTVE